MRATAASAMAWLVATTAATRSPTKRTCSLKSVSSRGQSSCSGVSRARQYTSAGELRCEKTLTTPGSASAARESMLVTMPCGMGLSSSLA